MFKKSNPLSGCLKIQAGSHSQPKLTAESDLIEDIPPLNRVCLKRKDGPVLTAADVSCLEELCS